MQRPTRRLGVPRPRLGEKGLAVAQRNDRVETRIERFDPIERRTHQLDARDLLRSERARQRHRVEVEKLGCGEEADMAARILA